MARFYLLHIFLLFSFTISAQDVTGVWSGFVLTSDKKLPYEIVISENNGQLNGYSQITFSVNDEEKVVIKTLKVKNESGKFILDDDEQIFETIRDEDLKKLKQSSILFLKKQDSSEVLEGEFKQNKIRKLRPASGQIILQKKDIQQSKLLVKLSEMKLLGNISFSKTGPLQEKDLITIEKPQELLPVSVFKKSIKVIGIPSKKEVQLNAINTSLKIRRIIPEEPAVTKTAIIPVSPPIVKKQMPQNESKAVVSTKPSELNKNTPLPTSPTVKPAIVAIKRTNEIIQTGAVVDITKRKIETIGNVTFDSDSLILSLYDNGEVDGDTVSVLMNGKTILDKQRLSTNVVTKTIYITPEIGDSLQLIMYAENLGSLPPNTGLLIIQDGNKRHEIRFAGDLKKNAAIILWRRK